MFAPPPVAWFEAAERKRGRPFLLDPGTGYWNILVYLPLGNLD
jgi:hypothetical protein